jgi:hypothetical protein
MGQLLTDVNYFSRRVKEEIARSRRSGTRFSLAVFTSHPLDGEPPEITCMQGLPAILNGVRETDVVSRISRDTVAVLLIDADGTGARKAAFRLLEHIGDDVGRWQVSLLDYPARESTMRELGLVA